MADFTGATVVGLQSYYADIAECYEAEYDLEPGTVVKIGGSKEITPTEFDHDPDVFGVVSTEPAFVLNSNPDEEDERIMVPVALVGRVPCKVFGPVVKGDRLVAFEGGAARAGGGTAFARSLETCDREDVRLVEVAIVTVK